MTLMIDLLRLLRGYLLGLLHQLLLELMTLLHAVLVLWFDNRLLTHHGPYFILDGR